jgi:hypothetical protein
MVDNRVAQSLVDPMVDSKVVRLSADLMAVAKAVQAKVAQWSANQVVAESMSLSSFTLVSMLALIGVTLSSTDQFTAGTGAVLRLSPVRLKMQMATNSL